MAPHILSVVVCSYPLTFVFLAGLAYDSLWQRPQALARALADRGNDVIYVDPPRYSPLAFFPAGHHGVPRHGVRVFSPVSFWPTYRGRPRAFQRGKMGCPVRFECGRKPVVCVISHPVWWHERLAGLAEPADLVVYDCCDDMVALEPDRAQALLVDQYERQLLESADAFVFSARPLGEKNRWGKPSAYVPNGVDAELLPLGDETESRPSGTTAIRVGSYGPSGRPIVGFLGVVGHWIDVELLIAAARVCNELDFEVHGPLETDVPRDIPGNLRFCGPVPYEGRGQVLRRFSVAVLPFRVDSAVTRFVNPIKIWEYLAFGLPVVSSPLPELSDFPPWAVTIATQGPGFADAIRKAIQAGERDWSQERRSLAQSNTWASRADELSSAISEFLSGTMRRSEPRQ